MYEDIGAALMCPGGVRFALCFSQSLALIRILLRTDVSFLISFILDGWLSCHSARPQHKHLPATQWIITNTALLLLASFGGFSKRSTAHFNFKNRTNLNLLLHVQKILIMWYILTYLFLDQECKVWGLSRCLLAEETERSIFKRPDEIGRSNSL